MRRGTAVAPGVVQTVSLNGLTTTNSAGLTLQNTTAATSGVPVQHSPMLVQSGTGHDTDGNVSVTAKYGWQVRPLNGNTVEAEYHLLRDVGAGSWTSILNCRYDSGGGIDLLNLGSTAIRLGSSPSSNGQIRASNNQVIIGGKTSGAVSFDLLKHTSQNYVEIRGGASGRGVNFGDTVARVEASEKVYFYSPGELSFYQTNLLIRHEGDTNASSRTTELQGADSSGAGNAGGTLYISGGAPGSGGTPGTCHLVGRRNGGTKDTAFSWDTNGSAARMSFYGGSLTAKLTISGASGGNAAVQSIATQLAAVGLFTNSTT